MIGYVAQGLILGLSAGASPGPFQFFLLSHAATHGWRRALPLAAAPLVTDALIVPVVLFLLASLPPAFLIAIRVAGALFVLWLAWGAWRTFRAAQPVDPQALVASDAAQRGFGKAVVMNFLNPNPYLFWSVILGPLTLQAWRASPGSAATLVAVFYIVFVGLNAALVGLFSLARGRGARVVHVLQGVSALALLLFGLYQLWLGVTSIVPL